VPTAAVPTAVGVPEAIRWRKIAIARRAAARARRAAAATSGPVRYREPQAVQPAVAELKA